VKLLLTFGKYFCLIFAVGVRSAGLPVPQAGVRGANPLHATPRVLGARHPGSCRGRRTHRHHGEGLVHELWQRLNLVCILTISVLKSINKKSYVN